MGLDMYLTIGKGRNREEVGYWRKANAIHNFFVNTIQNGVDDQEAYKVGKRTFQLLLKKCETLLDKAKEEGYDPDYTDCNYEFKPSKELEKACQEVLPSCSDFFFGGTDYDVWYFDSLEYTRTLIDGILEDWEPGQKKNYYYSCWW